MESSKVVPELISRFDFQLEDGGREVEPLNVWFVKQRNFSVLGEAQGESTLNGRASQLDW